MLKINDRVKVKPLQDKIHEEEDIFEGKTACVSLVDSWIYPIGVKFEDEKVQDIHEGLGGRRFFEFELELI